MKIKFKQWLGEAEQDGGMYAQRFVEFYDYVIGEYTEEVNEAFRDRLLKEMRAKFPEGKG